MVVVKVPHTEPKGGTDAEMHLTCFQGDMLHKTIEATDEKTGYHCDVCQKDLHDTAVECYDCDYCDYVLCQECADDIRFAMQFDNSIYEVHENVFVKGLKSSQDPFLQMDA